MTRLPYRHYQPARDMRVGSIPSHWKDILLRHATRFAYGDSLPDQERSGDEFFVFGSNGVVGTHHSANTLAPAIVIGRKGSFGAVNYTEVPAFCIDTTYFIDSRYSKQNLRWLYFALQTLGLDEVSRDTGVPGLSREVAYSCRIALPSLSEQHAIATFLDHEINKIDNLIAKQIEFLERLDEHRRALITEALTLGLDDKVALRATGNQFIPHVPMHWSLEKLKFLLATPLAYGANEAGDQNVSDDPRYVRITDIHEDGNLREDTRRSLPSKIAGPYLLQNGDVLLARSGATVGKSFLYQSSWGTCCFAGYLIRARCDQEKIAARLLYYYLSSDCYWGWVKAIQTQATIQNIGADRYATLLVPRPPLKEQREIVEHIEQKLSKVEHLRLKCIELISVYGERRSALITAAVTGQIDCSQFGISEVAA